MVIQLSVTAIWGIGAAGAVVFILAIAGIIFLCLRKKHKTLLTAINRDTERPRAHMSITDEDVLRMPGMRRVRPSPYGQQSGWIPVSSRENVVKRGLAPNPADIDPTTGLPPWPVRFPRNLKKTQSSPMVRVPLTALSPITERSTNNTAISPSLSKIVTGDAENHEPSIKDIVKVDDGKIDGPDSDTSPYPLKPKPLFHGQPRSFSHGTLTGLSEESKFKDSAQDVSKRTENQGMEVVRLRRSASLCGQQPGQAPTIPVPPLPFELLANRRSRRMQAHPDASPQRMSGMSLLSGDTSLLDEMTLRGFSQADTNLTSINMASPSGSIATNVGLGISNGSQSKWNFSRIDRAASQLSATKAHNIRPQLNQQHSIRASIHNSIPRSASSGLSMSLLDHNSPNAKVLPSATGTTLAIPGKVGRGPSQRARIPQGSPLNTMNVFKISEDMNPKRASTSILQIVSGNQGSPIKNLWTDRPTSIATEDPFRWDPKTSMQPGKKPSAMKKSTYQRHKRQSCVRISNIPVVIPSKCPSSFTSKNNRQQPFISPLTSPLPVLFRNQNQNYPTRNSQLSAPAPPPPSTATFNPQLPKGIRTSTTTTSSTDYYNNNTYSPTFSMIPLYEPPSPTLSDSSTSSLASTPTHNPSLTRPARHPNRRRAIFPSTHGSHHWPPLLSSSITPSDPPSNIPGVEYSRKRTSLATPPKSKAPHPVEEKGIANKEKDTQQNEEDNSRPSSSLFSFPDPPIFPPERDPSHVLSPNGILSKKSAPTGRHPRPPPPKRISPVRGPRPLSSPTCSRLRSRISKSPSPRCSVRSRSRSPGKKPSTSPSSSTKKLNLLRLSILELRRMNSEVHHSRRGIGGEGKGERVKGHVRYLSLGEEVEGGGEDGPRDEECRGDDRGEGEEGRKGEGNRDRDGVKGPRAMRTPRKGCHGKGGGGSCVGGGEKGERTPGSLYDAGGFLVDG